MLYWRIQWDDICQIHSLYVLQTTTEHTHLPHTCVYVRAIFFYLSIELSWVELRFQFLSVYFSLSQHNSKWINSFVRLFSLSHYLHVNKLGLSILFAVMLSLSVVLYGFVIFLVSLLESYFSLKKRIFCTERGFFGGNQFFEEKNFKEKGLSNLELSTDWVDWKWKIISANRYSLMVHIKFVCVIIHDHLMLRQIFHRNKKQNHGNSLSNSTRSIQKD